MHFLNRNKYTNNQTIRTPITKPKLTIFFPTNNLKKKHY